MNDKDRRKSAGLARARVCLKTHLEWLDGFPVSQSHGQLEWMLRPGIGRPEGTRIVTIDRDTIRRATLAVNRLTIQMADSAHQIFGDVTAWQISVTSLLESLKSSIHQDQNPVSEIPPAALRHLELANVLRLNRQFPALRELLKAIAVRYR